MIVIQIIVGAKLGASLIWPLKNQSQKISVHGSHRVDGTEESRGPSQRPVLEPALFNIHNGSRAGVLKLQTPNGLSTPSFTILLK